MSGDVHDAMAGQSQVPVGTPSPDIGVGTSGVELGKKMGHSAIDDDAISTSGGTAVLKALDPDHPELPSPPANVSASDQNIDVLSTVGDEVNQAIQSLQQLIGMLNQMVEASGKQISVDAGQAQEKSKASGSGGSVGGGSSAAHTVLNNFASWASQANFLAQIANLTEQMARMLSDMTAAAQDATKQLRAQKRENVSSQEQAIKQKGDDEAYQAAVEGITKLIEAGFTALSTVAIGLAARGIADDDPEKRKANFETWQTRKEMINGITQTINQMTEGLSKLSLAGGLGSSGGFKGNVIADISYEQAISTVAADKGEATAGALRSTTEFLNKLRDTMNEMLQMLLQLREKAFQVGYFSKS